MNFYKNWTLFLDRDGVINVRTPNDYIKTWDEFRFEEGALDAITRFSQHFKYIFVVTNQAGIGKGIFTEKALLSIHTQMINEIRKSGGRIDGVYYCAHAKTDNCICRKPNIGMALQAKHDFPDIDFKQACIIGDSISDMQFGQKLGMKTVFVTGKNEEAAQADHWVFDKKINKLEELFF